jgi:uncharacterized protein YbjQ (UPF0145 family)
MTCEEKSFSTVAYDGSSSDALEEKTVIITTGNEIETGQVVEYLGIVRGIVVRATGIGAGFIGGLKAIGGGNIEEWTNVCEAARQEAFNRMIADATHLGADAIIGMRYDATEFSQGASEVLAYGTAVKLAKK